MTVSDTPDPLVGQVIDGRYRITRRIDQGGMAVVYLADDLRLARTVALKIMLESLGNDPEFVHRLEREARSAAALTHPGIVAVYDRGMLGHRPYLVMEYVDGFTLRDLITEKAPIDPGRAVGLMTRIADAVGAAHAAGIIHRDLKPENILISSQGHLKVVDFGLARAVTASTASGFGTLLGTVSYVSPEVVTDGQADARSDVYALGVILFEMLTGQRPHTGETPIQVAYSHVHHDVVAPSSLVGEGNSPDYVDALVQTATAREPSGRPTEASIFAAQLREVRAAVARGVRSDPQLAARLREGASAPTVAIPELAVASASAGLSHKTMVLQTIVDAPPPAPPVPQLTRATPPRKRRRRGWAMLVLLLILGLAGAGGWYWLQGRYTTTPNLVGSSQEQAAALAAAGKVAVRFESEYSETVPKGQVIHTDPAAGVRILQGGTVAAFLSLGPERYPVPKLAGTLASDADKTLTAGHLALGTVTEVWSDQVPIGTIVSTAPDAGGSVKPGTNVDVAVSKGPQPIDIASFVNKPYKDAQAFCTKSGLTCKQTDAQFSDTVAEGSVISQDPASGQLAKGGTVSFVVSKGPEMIQVPQVTGLSENDAKKALSDAGFKVAVNYRSKWLHVVTHANPEQGTMAPKGSTITIFVV